MFSKRNCAAILWVIALAIRSQTAIAGPPHIFVNAQCGNDAWTGEYTQCSAPDGYKRTIQAALDAVPDGGMIIVSPGTYSGEGNRDLDFKGKAVRLSGYDCTIDCSATRDNQHRAFYFHSGETQESAVQGFRIINGLHWKGGAVLCQNSSPEFVNCTFENNEATDDDTGGGAVYNENSSPTFETCTFTNNKAMPSASYGGAMTNETSSPILTGCTFTGNQAWNGGGIYNSENSNPILENCIFTENQAARGAGMGNVNSSPQLSRCIFAANAASNHGGGMNNLAQSNPALTHCIFRNNSAGDGGAVANWDSSPEIANCLFTANTAASHGGAVCNDNSRSRLINCTIYGNNAPTGGGLAAFDYSRVTVSNSIIWANTSEQIYTDNDECLSMAYSCTPGGWDGPGNIAANPLFADPDGPDDVLGTTDDDLSLTDGSPCIDAGDNSAVPPTLLADMRGLGRFADDLAVPNTGLGTPPIVDIGICEHQGILYVDDDATESGTGSSWTDAFKRLQDALDAATAGVEIHIAQGTYKPDQGRTAAYNDRTESFLLGNRIILRGGYAGIGAADPDARDVRTYETVLSGDLHGNDWVLADAAGLLEHPSRAENSFHVVKIAQDAYDIVLDGLTITGGNANEGGYQNTTASGGGIYMTYPSGAAIKECTIIANSANFEGGGIYNSSALTMDRCRFFGNAAKSGGAMENNSDWSDPATLTNCIFSGNFASSDGGAISTKCAGIKCTGCTFSMNRAEGRDFYRGGGITGDDDTYMWLTNCIFWGNSDADGSGESSQIFQDYVSQTSVNYCCVQGWTGILGGEGNFSTNPLYRDADGPDDAPGTEDDNLRLSSGSPCFDSGDPDYVPQPGETDLDGNPRIIGSRVDIGAYEDRGDVPEDGVIYVDDDATGANDGSNWSNAFRNLQDALAAASGDSEIRVAQGTYKPDQGIGIARYDRQATFQLKSKITIIGGYAGIGEPAPGLRDIEQYLTILSGDLDNNDGPDCTNCSDNSFHVVTGTDAQDAVLDGLTITAGNADGSYPHNNGGGVIIDYTGGSPALIDCTITNSYAESGGGGMYVARNAVVTLTRCTFTGNKSGYTAGAFYNYKADNILLYRCTFSDNSASNAGALSNFLGSMTIRNCIFAGNTAEDYSGGQGGAIRHWGNSESDFFLLLNCAIVGNSATGIGGPGKCGGLYVQDEKARIDNCIFWLNSDAEGRGQAAQIHDVAGESVLFNCCVQGWTGGGTANIADDPLLIDPDGPDNLFGTEDDNLRLLPGSPCLDAGNNHAVSEPFTKDMDGNPRIQNEVVDIGPYEGPSPGIILDTQSLTIPEGATATFTVVLSTDPQGTISVDLTHHSGDPDIRFDSIPSLPFNSANYDKPQTVTLRALEDPDVINGSALIHVNANGYFTAGLTVTELDNESSAILYVDDDAPEPGNGLDWAAAFTSLQDALRTAAQYPQFNEIRVAQGTYKPDQGSGMTPGSRDATFQLINNVTLKGGYAGLAAPDHNARDIELYRTILSGDLDGNDVTVAEPAGLIAEPTRNENSRHVVTATDCGRTAVIDGFTITGGNADGPAEAEKYGGGICDGKPTISNCTVIANSADINGGGISFYHDTHTPGGLLIDSTVENNAAPSGGGIRGCAEIKNCTVNANAATEYSAGGIYFGSSCETTVTDTIISNNTAAQHGGAACVGSSNSHVVFTRCTFVGNSAGENAGAVHVDGCTCGSNVLLDRCKLIANSADDNGGAVYSTGYALIQLRSCLLTGNSASQNGGAIRTNDDAESEIYNCTFAHNTAAEFGGAISGYNAVVNSILWYNADSTGQTGPSSQITGGHTGSLGIQYCCIQNMTSGGIGIIDDDPLFIDPYGPDDTPGNGDENFRFQEGSPCIDSGNNHHVPQDSNDLAGNPRIMGLIVDMGAYEFPQPDVPEDHVRYDIIDLGTLGGEDSMAHAINNNGQIVGWARTYPHAITACMFDFRNPDNNIDLAPYGWMSGGAYSINIHGVPVGTYPRTSTAPYHATIFDPADPCDNLDLHGPESLASLARSINDLGQIVGSEQYPTGDYKATLFDPTGAGENIDLAAGGLSNPDAADHSSAMSINNEGQIVGYAYTASNPVHIRAVLFDPTGEGNNIILTPDEEDQGEALSINDAGQIVGWSKNTGGATIFNPADPANNLALGTLPGAIESKAYSINNRGQIVGSVRFWEEGRSYYSHAAIFDPTGGGDNRDLNELIDHNTGWELIRAHAINDNGWIVGFGRYTEGQTRAFLLIPRQNSRLVGHWKLDESEGDTAEDSAGQNHGTLKGDPLWLPNEGRVEGALLFDGQDDYVDCGNSSDFDITDQITVAAWVNIAAVNMDWQTVVAKGDSAWRLSTAQDEYRFHFAVTGGPPWNYINGDIVVDPGEWHHICGTYDGASLRLYIDCIEDPAGPVAEANGVTTSDHAVYIGENQERPGRNWDGLIDDVRIYNYALTPAEISQFCKIEVLYVDKDARGRNNGCCWADAFQCLQDALATATDGTEIRVAEGTYRPDCGEGIASGDRDATCQLKNGVTIKGGYAGHGQPEPNARDISQYMTILSGDLARNDGPGFVNYDENSYHILTGSGTDATAVIDGFTITHGGVVHEDQCGDQNRGGGLYNLSGSPTVLNCTFIANAATDNCGGGGAAIYNRENSNPTVKNCTFTANAYKNADDDGGGAVSNYKSNPVFEDCVFTQNSSDGGGGAMRNYQSNPTINRCVFMHNHAEYEGGAIANEHSSPVLNDCTFVGNSSNQEGGALRNAHWSAPVFSRCVFIDNAAMGSHAHGGAVCNNYWDEPKFTQCLFAGNSANHGGAIYSYHGSVEVTNCTFTANSATSGGAMHCRAEDTVLTNCILWGNTAEQGKEIYFKLFPERPATLTIGYTDIQHPDLGIHIEPGNTLDWGPGNITADPCFADPENGDYHLKSNGWRWDPEWKEWTFDRETSRCIDAGNPGSPLLDEPLSVPEDPDNEYSENIRINMGAYGGTAEASLPPIGWSLLADINNDGIVNFCDFAHTGADWKATASQMPADLDRNKDAAPPDLSLLADDWLKETLWKE